MPSISRRTFLAAGSAAIALPANALPALAAGTDYKEAPSLRDRVAAGSLPQGIAVSPPARTPTSKGQCKTGGWRSFPGFKNQGDCVSFVATGGKSPPANSP